jgi:hypothetical protein
MRKSERPKLILLFFVGVSIFGLLTTLMLALYTPKTRENLPWRKPLVGSIFLLICASGIMAGFFPEKCSGTFGLHGKKKLASSHDENPKLHVAMRGHHPDCGRFSSHVVQMDSHTLCAACTGLILGAILALIGATFYFFGTWHTGETGFPAVVAGVIGVLLGFLQLKLEGFIRLLLNVVFVLGAFLTLVGIDQLAENLWADIFLIVLIIFWILTRITLSQWDHWRTCQNCKLECRILEERKVGSVSSAHSI